MLLGVLVLLITRRLGQRTNPAVGIIMCPIS